jgi:hypothetical protein
MKIQDIFPVPGIELRFLCRTAFITENSKTGNLRKT